MGSDPRFTVKSPHCNLAPSEVAPIRWTRPTVIKWPHPSWSDLAPVKVKWNILMTIDNHTWIIIIYYACSQNTTLYWVIYCCLTDISSKMWIIIKSPCHFRVHFYFNYIPQVAALNGRLLHSVPAAHLPPRIYYVVCFHLHDIGTIYVFFKNIYMFYIYIWC